VAAAAPAGHATHGHRHRLHPQHSCRVSSFPVTSPSPSRKRAPHRLCRRRRPCPRGRDAARERHREILPIETAVVLVHLNWPMHGCIGRLLRRTKRKIKALVAHTQKRRHTAINELPIYPCKISTSFDIGRPISISPPSNYSLQFILFFANMDVSTTKICLDIFILAKSIIDHRKYTSLVHLARLHFEQFLFLVSVPA
jgi:hypothetical protein